MDMKLFIENFASQLDETELEMLAPDTAFRELEEWSSFLALSIMAMVKTEYDVELSADEMRNANTIQELYDVVKSHL